MSKMKTVDVYFCISVPISGSRRIFDEHVIAMVRLENLCDFLSDLRLFPISTFDSGIFRICDIEHVFIIFHTTS